MKKKRLSLLEYARKRNVSEQRVRKLVNDGRLSAKKVKGRLTLNPKEADKEWSDNTKDKFKPIKDDATTPVVDIELDGIILSKENANEIRRIAEAKREIWSAKREQLDYEEKAGQLVSIKQIEKEAFETARIVRDAILTIPDKTAPLLVGIKDQTAIHIILSKELNIAITELARGVEKINISSGIQPGNDARPYIDGK